MTDDPTPVLMILMSLGGACCATVGALLTLGGIYLYYRSTSSDAAPPRG